MGESSFGTLLQLGDGGATEVFTTVAEVLDISGPNIAVDTEDITNHSSTGAWEEVVASVIRSGEVTFDVNWDPAAATHDESSGLWAELVGRAASNWQLVLTDTDSHTLAFSAFTVGFVPSNPVSGARRGSVTLKPTGQITIS